MTEEYEKWAYDIKECADKSGVFFTHSHAPFHAGYRGTLVEKTRRCSSILGIKYTVVHPLWDKGNGVFYEGEEFIDVNKKAILPLLEAAERYNVIILSENLLWGDSIKSTAISRLVKEVNSPYFGWCYDTGHANTMKDDCNELLKCDIAPLSLHIHDNSGKYYSDEHLIPFDGNIDWRKLLSILKAIGYKGELVLEAHHQSIASPDEQRVCLPSRIKRTAISG